MVKPQTSCRNCGAGIDGEFCSQCGQREGRADVLFVDAAGDLVGDVFTWDSRFWRTLIPLMIRPGFLPAEFMAGRRARYVPPVRLYLIISFVLFLGMSMITLFGGSSFITVAADAPNEAGQAESDAGRDSIPRDIDSEAETDEVVLAPITLDFGEEDSSTGAFSIDLADDNSPAWLQQLDARMEKNAEDLQEDSGEFVRQLLEYLPQVMFLLLPFFALILKLCFFFSSFHYLQHAIFALYYHSFAYLAYMLSALIDWLGYGGGGLIFVLVVIYLPIALARCYGSGIGGAIGKSVFIYVTYGLALAISLAMASMLALAFM